MKKALTGIAIVGCILFIGIVSGKFSKTIHTTEERIENEYQDGMDLAMAQEIQMTKDPALGYVPTERLLKAQVIADQIRQTRSTLLQTQALSWTERGPNNVAGRVRALFIDKRDATGNTIITAGVAGGIWKCTNFKTSPVWIPLNEFMNNLAVCALVQDPVNTNVMYAGTGEGWFNFDNIRGNGIFKTTDGGLTWTQLTSTDVAVTKNFENVMDLEVTSGGVLLASCRSSTFCNRGGIMRSTDGGTTWATVVGSYNNSGSCNDALNYRGADLEIAANGDIYATTGFNSTATANTGRIWKSTAASAGATWVDITPTATSGTWSRIELACAPGDANTIVALIAGSDNAIKSIQKSTDGGANWSVINNPAWCDQGVSKADFTRGQAWYDLAVAIDPNSVNTFVIGGIDLMRTTNNGASFLQISQWAAGCSGSTVHADIHNIIFYPGSSSEIIACTDGGIFYSANSGTSFTNKNSGLNITQYYGVALHPTAGSNYMLAGAQDNGTQKFSTAGINTTTNVIGGDGTYCFIDQDNPSIQIGSLPNASYRVSRDGGASFGLNISNGSGSFVNPADYDNDMNILFHAVANGTYGYIKNIDAGGLIPVQTSISQLAGNAISAIKADPNVPKRLWLAGSGTGIPVILKLDNDTGLAPIVTVCAATLPTGGNVSCIDVENGNSDHVLVTLSNYGINSVYESTDGGANWTSIEGNLPDMPIRWGMFLPDGVTFTQGAVSGIALATETGVWTTNMASAGTTVWVPNNGGMANVSIRQIKYRSSDRTLVAATHGRGLFSTILGVATAVNTVQNNKQFISLLFPTITHGTLHFVTGGATGVKQMDIEITDMQGKRLLKQTVSYRNGDLQLTNFPAGTYIVKWLSDNRKYAHVQKVLKQ